MKQLLLSPSLYRWRSSTLKRLSNLSRVTLLEPVLGRTKTHGGNLTPGIMCLIAILFCLPTDYKDVSKKYVKHLVRELKHADAHRSRIPKHKVFTLPWAFPALWLHVVPHGRPWAISDLEPLLLLDALLLLQWTRSNWALLHQQQSHAPTSGCPYHCSSPLRSGILGSHSPFLAPSLFHCHTVLPCFLKGLPFCS